MTNAARIALALAAGAFAPALADEQGFASTGEIRFVAYGALASGAAWTR